MPHKVQYTNQHPASTYFAYPEGNKTTEHAILILTDVIGHRSVSPYISNLNILTHATRSINAQLIADQFAANGYLTLMPDLFHGDAIPMNRPADFDMPKWRSGHGTERVDPVVEAVIKELKTTHGVKRIGGVGYCFGGKYLARFMAQGKGIDVGYTAHPSYIDVAELKAVTGPFSIAAAETDAIFPAEKRHESEEILKEMDIPYQLVLYSDVAHGFSTRGDISQRRQRFAKEAAFEQAVVWFNEWLKE